MVRRRPEERQVNGAPAMNAHGDQVDLSFLRDPDDRAMSGSERYNLFHDTTFSHLIRNRRPQSLLRIAAKVAPILGHAEVNVLRYSLIGERVQDVQDDQAAYGLIHEREGLLQSPQGGL
jgi:hypothetical protein